MYWLKFVQNAVHYPVGRSGTDSVAGADCLSLQMLYYRFNQRELYMRRVRRQDFFTSAFCMQGYRVVGEDGEADNYVNGFKGLKMLDYDKYVSFECGCQGDRNVLVPAAVELLRKQWEEA